VNAVIIIQARTASTRLPAKALLPIAGHSSAILAALRASNRQHHTILATSDRPSDDVLAGEAQNMVWRLSADRLRMYSLGISWPPRTWQTTAL